jgi:hypothetical protein
MNLDPLGSTAGIQRQVCGRALGDAGKRHSIGPDQAVINYLRGFAGSTGMSSISA